jgi:hypothetical protein
MYDAGTDYFSCCVPLGQRASAIDLRSSAISVTRYDGLWVLQDASQFWFLRYISTTFDTDGTVKLVVVDLHSYLFCCSDCVCDHNDGGNKSFVEFSDSTLQPFVTVLFPRSWDDYCLDDSRRYSADLGFQFHQIVM